MAGNLEINSNLDLLGSLKISTVPNLIGTVLTYNTTTRSVGQRTYNEILNDLNLNGLYAKVDGSNLTNITNWRTVLGITTALSLNLQETTNNGNSTTNNIILPQLITNLSTLGVGIVSSDAGVKLWSGSGNSQYGLSVNANGGLDIMANQTGQPIRFWSGGDNVTPIRTADFNGSNVTFYGGLYNVGQIDTGSHGNSAQWNVAYQSVLNLNNNYVRLDGSSLMTGGLKTPHVRIANFGAGNNATRHHYLTTNANLYGDFTIYSTDINDANIRYDLTIDPLGNVGLGKLNPQHKLDVDGDIKGTQFVASHGGLIINSLGGVNENTTKIFFQNAQATIGWAISQGNNGVSQEGLGFGTWDGSSYSDKVRIFSDSNIYTNNYGSADLWNQGYNLSLNAFEKEGVLSCLDANTFQLGLLTVVNTTLNLPEASYGVIYANKANTSWYYQVFRSTGGNVWERRAINPSDVNQWSAWVKTNSNTSVDQHFVPYSGAINHVNLNGMNFSNTRDLIANRNIHVSGDDSTLFVGNNRDIGFIKKGGYAGFLAVGNSNPFKIKRADAVIMSNDAVDNFSDLLTIDIDGRIITAGNGNIMPNGELLIQQAPTYNATGLSWKKDDGSLLGGMGALTTGNLHHHHYMGWGTAPWDLVYNFAVSENYIRYKNQDLWHSGNFTPTLQGVAVNGNWTNQVIKFIGSHTEWLFNDDASTNAHGFFQSLSDKALIGTLNNKPLKITINSNDVVSFEGDSNIYTNNYGSADLWNQAYSWGNPNGRFMPLQATESIQTDLNTVSRSVIMHGYNWLNAPNGYNNGIAIVTTTYYSADWICQEFKVIDYQNIVFRRTRYNGNTWSAWVEHKEGMVQIGGTGTFPNPVFLGWNGSSMQMTVDTVNVGIIATENYVQDYMNNNGFVFRGNVWAWGTDYNNITKSGRYVCTSDAQQQSMANRPSDYSGVLEITYSDYSGGVGTWCFQRFQEYGGSENTYTRRYYNGIWSNWKNISSQVDISNRVIGWDNTYAIGFHGSDLTKPYFYHISGNYIDLATKNYTDGNFARTNGSNVVHDSIWNINARGIYGQMPGASSDDWFRIVGIDEGANSGALDIATSDDGDEAIYVTQYTGNASGTGTNKWFETIHRRAILLGRDGNTEFPRRLKSGGYTVDHTSGDGLGIALYNEGVDSAYRPSYGLFFGQSATFGGLGHNNGDWNTYFTMSGANNRGWLFKHSTTGNVVGINGNGVISTLHHGTSEDWSKAGTTARLSPFYASRTFNWSPVDGQQTFYITLDMDIYGGIGGTIKLIATSSWHYSNAEGRLEMDFSLLSNGDVLHTATSRCVAAMGGLANEFYIDPNISVLSTRWLIFKIHKKSAAINPLFIKMDYLSSGDDAQEKIKNFYSEVAPAYSGIDSYRNYPEQGSDWGLGRDLERWGELNHTDNNRSGFFAINNGTTIGLPFTYGAMLRTRKNTFEHWELAGDISGNNLYFRNHTHGWKRLLGDTDIIDYDHRRYYTGGGIEQWLGAQYAVYGGSPTPDMFKPGSLALAMGNGVTGTGEWADILWLSGYEGGDVPMSTAIVSSKQSRRIGYAKQDHGQGSWGAFHEFITTENLGNGLQWNGDTLDVIGGAGAGVTGLGNGSTFMQGDVSIFSGGGLNMQYNFGSKNITISNAISVGNGIAMSGGYQLSQTITTAGSGSVVTGISQTSNGFQVNYGNINVGVTAIAMNTVNTTGLLVNGSGSATVNSAGTFQMSFTSGYSLVTPTDRALMDKLTRQGLTLNYTSSSTSALTLTNTIANHRIYRSLSGCQSMLLHFIPQDGDRITIHGEQFGGLQIRNNAFSSYHNIYGWEGASPVTTYIMVMMCVTNARTVCTLVYRASLSAWVVESQHY